MIRLAVILVWISVGMGVTAIEAKRKPQVLTDAGFVVFSVVFWPMFPAGRAYQAVVNP